MHYFRHYALRGGGSRSCWLLTVGGLGIGPDDG